MAPARTSIRITRVICTLEGDRPEPELMEMASLLATTLEAELSGVFIKAQDLVNLASLPGSQAVISRTGARRELRPGEMEDSLNRLAARARRRLGEMAARRQLAFSFETLTGRTEDIFTGRASRGELIALSRLPGTTAPPATEDGAPLLIVPRGLAPNRPISLIYEGATAALGTAARLASALERELIVVIPSGENSATLQRTAKGWLTRRKVAAHVRQAQPANEDMIAALFEDQPGLIVADRGTVYEGGLLQAAGAGRTALLLLPR
ncbi:MAG: hypothetical protein R3360_04965 [Alphaproteobacteria bacterium]|nr:hypothetical protein [Alphaproteobacteria bacterium]